MTDLAKGTVKIDGVYAWRFANPDGTSQYQREAQAVGQLCTLPPTLPLSVVVDPTNLASDATRPRLRNWGFHAALSPLSALHYGQRCGIERVRLSGEIVTETAPESGFGCIDLVASSERTTLWRADAAHVLLGFAADCAQRLLVAVAADHPGTHFPSTTSKPWDLLVQNALTVARHYVAGEATGENVRAAFSILMSERHKASPMPQRVFDAHKAASEVLAACYYDAGKSGPQNLRNEIPDSVWNCAERCALAVCEGSDGAAFQAATRAETVWQNKTLEARLMALAPAEHAETKWKSYASVA